jgi:hypothetical protein
MTALKGARQESVKLALEVAAAGGHNAFIDYMVVFYEKSAKYLTS